MAVVYPHSGKAAVVALIVAGAPWYVGWGTGAGTSAVGDTTLFTEASETRVSGTVSTITTTETDDTMQVVGELVADGTKTITNAGLFDASTAGEMLLKGDHAGVPLLLNDAIEYTMQHQQT